ncbi:hypothetical protein Y032_0654g1189 [Ancylostoma ceylanicum]|uniref:Uncharacterized protein n=1 Tax=Ancylostoma ceylanicum TaxID=53326 RepID=A0A016WJP3_9BILA|nr:hypothetical protein Y032_0654g1189 [Ancylostoma ceylanicum]
MPFPCAIIEFHLGLRCFKACSFHRMAIRLPTSKSLGLVGFAYIRLALELFQCHIRWVDIPKNGDDSNRDHMCPAVNDQTQHLMARSL